MQSIVCGAPCVSVSLTKPNKQTSQSLPLPRRTNKQTQLLLVCFQLFAFQCHIFISSPAVCQLFCARYLCLCLYYVYWLAGRLCPLQLTDCLPTHLTRFCTYRRDYFWLWLHFLQRVLWAALLPFGCLIYCAVSDCFIASLGRTARRTCFDALLSSRFMLSTFIVLWITRPVRACAAHT